MGNFLDSGAGFEFEIFGAGNFGFIGALDCEQEEEKKQRQKKQKQKNNDKDIFSTTKYTNTHENGAVV